MELKKHMRGQMGGVVSVIIFVVGLILLTTFITNSLPNFTAGSIERTVMTFVVPIMAIGLLGGLAYIGSRR